MSICIDACAAQETIVVTTRSSVYGLVVLRGNRGEVLVRGGSHSRSSGRCYFTGRLQTTARSTYTQSTSVSA